MALPSFQPSIFETYKEVFKKDTGKAYNADFSLYLQYIQTMNVAQQTGLLTHIQNRLAEIKAELEVSNRKK